MAVKFDKVQPGMVLFHRFQQKVGNVRGMKALSETRHEVRSVDSERRMVRMSGSTGIVQVPASHLHRYFTWSMRDPEAAELVRNGAGHVTKVIRKKGAKNSPAKADPREG